MLRVLILVMMLPLTLFGQLIPNNVMPFGAYGKGGTGFTDGELDSIRTILGFNQYMSGWFNDTAGNALTNFDTNGVHPYPWWATMGIDEEPQIKYAHSTYFITHPEIDSSENYRYKFNNISGSWSCGDSLTGYLAYDGSGLMLSDLWISLRNWWDWVPYLQYSAFINMDIGANQADSDAIVGIFRVYNTNFDPYQLRFIDTVHVGDLPANGQLCPTLLKLHNDMPAPNNHPYFTVFSDDTLEAGAGIKFQFETVGTCTTYVDYVKICDQYGARLIDSISTQNIVREIKQSVTRPRYRDRIMGWFLKDTEDPANYRPFAFIDSLAIDTMTRDPFWTKKVNCAAWINARRAGAGRAYADFMRLAKPRMLWTYLYPIFYTTRFTGYVYGDSGYLQSAFEEYITGPLDTLRHLMQASDTTKEFLYTPQYWYWPNPDSSEPRRLPTKSEVRCLTYLGMCYRPSSILGWIYNSAPDFNNPWGIVKYNGTLTTIGEVIRDDINPYIKAIDSIYLQLNWLNAYPYQNPDSIPANSIIDSIDAQYQFPCHCIRDSVEYPTDIGWFHVGEFTDSLELGVSYFMLVNRSCSLCEWDSTETSPVIATVNLNPAIVGSNYALIIDLAKGTSASDWTGYPETTYSGILDGSIPYTVNLKAGEGRLFKVIPTNEIPFEVTLDEQGFIYQGGLNAAGEFVIDTLRLRGPAVINASPDDTTSISVNGAIIAEGFENEQIVFRSDSSSGWEGIVIGSNAYGDFKYCSIINAVTGIEINQGSELNVSHCLFDSITTNGIENTRGILSVSICYFRYNLLKGVNSFAGVAIIDSTTFENCCRYGVYINNHPSGTYDSTIISNCTIYQTPSPESAQYGIYVYNNAKIRLANNLIRATGQGGIRLSASNARVYNNIIRNVAQYGILIENGASVTVRNCVTDTIYTGIYSSANTACYVRWTRFKNQSYGVRTWGVPNLGDSREYGNNDFEGCSSMYIYKTQIVFPPPTVYAQYNYFGPGTPDSTKFSPGVRFDPWLLSFNPKKRIFDEIPESFSLGSNYPNPFNPQTAISFNLIEPAQTKVLIYNVLGQKIKTLVNEHLSPGQYSYIWDGRNEIGVEAASGVYLYRIGSGSFIQTKKMTLIR